MFSLIGAFLLQKLQNPIVLAILFCLLVVGLAYWKGHQTAEDALQREIAEETTKEIVHYEKQKQGVHRRFHSLPPSPDNALLSRVLSGESPKDSN